MIKELEKVIAQVFKKFDYDEKFARVSISNRPELCDFQVNGVFSIAKEFHKNPILIGEELVSEINKLDNFGDYFSEVSFVKPGFINIKVSDIFVARLLNNMIADKDYGIKKVKEDITCVVDYGGPNIAKPLHVGHLRPAVIGQSIYEILKAKGYKTIGDVHLGDIGLQMGQVIYGLLDRGLKPEDIDIDLLQEIYPKMSALCKSDEEVASECRRITKELQDGNLEYEAYFKVMYEVSLNDIKRIYNYLGVSFDYWYGEKDSYKYMDDLMAYLDSKGVVEVDDGAKIVRVQEEGDNKEIPPLLLQGKSGAYLYATSDVATIYQRMKDWDPKYIIYVVDGRQRLHFEQVFRTCYKSELTKGVSLEHAFNGTINGPDGKPFKTRSGETLRLEMLIDKTKETFLSKKESNKDMNEEDVNKIVNAIIKYAELQNNRERDYIFDIEKFSDVNGKTGPYILYTAVRIRKLVEANKFDSSVISEKVYNEYDKELRMKLLEVTDVVNNACDSRMPHYIADYLYDLAVLTNTFYQNNNISKLEDLDNKRDWINLLSYIYDVMEKLLSLLIIEIPSEM